MQRTDIERKAEELGFDMVKIIKPPAFDNYKNEWQRRWSEYPETRWYYEANKYDNPMDIMPNAKSLIMMAVGHVPYHPFPEGYMGFNSHYDTSNAIIKKVGELAKYIKSSGHEAIAGPAIPYKPAANISGIGFYGKNSIIYNKQLGSFISIRAILTDAEFPYDEENDIISDCGECTICIDTCPTGAIKANGEIEISRCLRYYTLRNINIPWKYRKMVGNIKVKSQKHVLIVGCDICQRVCPHNKHIAPVDYKGDIECLSIEGILSEWQIGLKPRLKKIGDLIGSNYARAGLVLGMAILAAGNSDDKKYLPYLKDCLMHDIPRIRGLAAWAIAMQNGTQYTIDIKNALSSEADEHAKFDMENSIEILT